MSEVNYHNQQTIYSLEIFPMYGKKLEYLFFQKIDRYGLYCTSLKCWTIRSSYHRTYNNIFALGYRLVAEKYECFGSEIYQDYQKTIEACYNICKWKSSMFIYGREGNCDSNGCKCWCETASKEGRCIEGRRGNRGFDLYESTLILGKILIDISLQ